MKLADNKATLSFSNGAPSVEMPVYQGNIGPDVIDIRKLYAQTGMFTYDPGFLSTAACQSAITYIDGDKGELLYRGYPIEQLAKNCNFLETCYLLLYGELPNQEQKAAFNSPGIQVLIGCEHEEYGHMAALSPATRTELATDFS